MPASARGQSLVLLEELPPGIYGLDCSVAYQLCHYIPWMNRRQVPNSAIVLSRLWAAYA